MRKWTRRRRGLVRSKSERTNEHEKSRTTAERRKSRKPFFFSKSKDEVLSLAERRKQRLIRREATVRCCCDCFAHISPSPSDRALFWNSLPFTSTSDREVQARRHTRSPTHSLESPSKWRCDRAINFCSHRTDSFLNNCIEEKMLHVLERSMLARVYC